MLREYDHAPQHWTPELVERARAFGEAFAGHKDFLHAVQVAQRAGRMIGKSTLPSDLCSFFAEHGKRPELLLLLEHAFRSGYAEAWLENGVTSARLVASPAG